MIEIVDPFDPSLKPVFSKEGYRGARQYPQDGKTLFYLLLQNFDQSAVYPLAYHFIDQHLSSIATSKTIDDGGDWLESLQVDSVHAISKLSFTQERFKTCLLQTLPVLLNEPCWLQKSFPTAVNQSPLALNLSSVCNALKKDDLLSNRFQALMLNAGLDIPALSSVSFTQKTTIDDLFIDFAALQLALARFPRIFFPEILGFTLAYCQSPCLFEYVFTCDQNPDLSDYIAIRQARLSSVKPALINLIQRTLSKFEKQKALLSCRIGSGFHLYCQFNDSCHTRLRENLEQPESASQVLAKLFSDKASAAFGHHRNIILAGRSLDDWFGEEPFDSTHFLAALLESSYFNRENPAASPLLKLFEFNGPMFGVLTEPELGILKNALLNRQILQPVSPHLSKKVIARSCLPDEYSDASLPFGKLGNRDLYYFLVNVDRFPGVLPSARDVVERVLRYSRVFSRMPFKKFCHETFSSHIDSLYQREMKAFEPLQGKPKLSREAYVWGIEQLAPTILTDGCWLQKINRLNFNALQPIGKLLIKIYDDENGNGVLEHNHPYIYSQLLRSLGIELPPIHAQTFCRHSGFIDSAFDIPVYLLSIAQFPQEFLPELLGLNLAIELSGLGKVYMRLAEELKFWAIDPKIVNIHITIDNVASGHTALAKEAIQLYLDHISSEQGDAAMQSHWRRIYTGYCSLATVSRPFAFSLAFHYLYKRFKARYTSPHLFTRRSDQNV